MNKFNEMSERSNKLGLKYLNKIFKNKQETIIKEEFDKFSTNDFIIYNNDETILVEIKVRKRFYDRLVFEKDKLDRLMEKAKQLDIEKVWYLNVIDDDTTDFNCIVFNGEKIFNGDILDHSKEVLLSGQVDELPNDKIILCKYMMPKYTAKFAEKIPKLTYIIPVSKGFGFKKKLF